jgi:hypothetical protein
MLLHNGFVGQPPLLFIRHLVRFSSFTSLLFQLAAAISLLAPYCYGYIAGLVSRQTQNLLNDVQKEQYYQTKHKMSVYRKPLGTTGSTQQLLPLGQYPTIAEALPVPEMLWCPQQSPGHYKLGNFHPHVED